MKRTPTIPHIIILIQRLFNTPLPSLEPMQTSCMNSHIIEQSINIIVPFNHIKIQICTTTSIVSKLHSLFNTPIYAKDPGSPTNTLPDNEIVPIIASFINITILTMKSTLALPHIMILIRHLFTNAFNFKLFEFFQCENNLTIET